MSAAVQNNLAAFFTVAIYTLVLYKDNKVFRLAETVLVGITAANGIVVTFHNYIKPTLVNDVGKDHKYWYVLPVILGLMMYARFIKPVAWLSRVPMGFWLGIGAGYIFTRTPGVFISQIQATFLSLNTVNNFLFVLGVVTVLSYFFFTVQADKEPMRTLSGIGKVFLLVGFGAAFANTVMTRVSVLLGRMQFLINDVLKIK